MKYLTALLIGGLFGLGIAISGMANPAKVVNFFDIAGTWDPSLIFVMVFAMFTAMAGYRIVFRSDRPLFESSFSLPTSKQIDAPLVLGSAAFGIGWGISGFCPGGAIPALGYGEFEALTFVGAMAAGIYAAKAAARYLPRRPALA
jgi:uncharacterized membrane protein YedE/YeeE